MYFTVLIIGDLFDRCSIKDSFSSLDFTKEALIKFRMKIKPKIGNSPNFIGLGRFEFLNAINLFLIFSFIDKFLSIGNSLISFTGSSNVVPAIVLVLDKFS